MYRFQVLSELGVTDVFADSASEASTKFFSEHPDIVDHEVFLTKAPQTFSLNTFRALRADGMPIQTILKLDQVASAHAIFQV